MNEKRSQEIISKGMHVCVCFNEGWTSPKEYGSYKSLSQADDGMKIKRLF